MSLSDTQHLLQVVNHSMRSDGPDSEGAASVLGKLIEGLSNKATAGVQAEELRELHGLLARMNVRLVSAGAKRASTRGTSEEGGNVGGRPREGAAAFRHVIFLFASTAGPFLSPAAQDTLDDLQMFLKALISLASLSPDDLLCKVFSSLSTANLAQERILVSDIVRILGRSTPPQSMPGTISVSSPLYQLRQNRSPRRISSAQLLGVLVENGHQASPPIGSMEAGSPRFQRKSLLGQGSTPRRQSSSAAAIPPMAIPPGSGPL
jgi:hypothetical protein